MITILLHLLSTLGLMARQAWSFARAKVLFYWLTYKMIGPRILGAFLAYRALQYACAIAIGLVIYNAIIDAISLAVITVDSYTHIRTLLQQTGWGSWLVWDGPLQARYLWAQLVSTFSFYCTLQTCAYLITKAEFWLAPAFKGGYTRGAVVRSPVGSILPK